MNRHHRRTFFLVLFLCEFCEFCGKHAPPRLLARAHLAQSWTAVESLRRTGRIAQPVVEIGFGRRPSARPQDRTPSRHKTVFASEVHGEHSFSRGSDKPQKGTTHE
jgi:hypothetical protein